MDPSQVLYCSACGNTIVAGNQIDGIIACNRCGLTIGESSSAMQDELIKLLNQNLSFGNIPQKQPVSDRPPLHYSASAHYIPPVRYASVSETPSPQPPSEPAFQLPPFSMQLNDEDAAAWHDTQQILIQHKIDPSALTSTQQLLFHHADALQRMRLIELWRISPNINDPRTEQEIAARQQQADEHHHEAEPYIQNGYGVLQERDPNQALSEQQAAGKDMYQPMGSAVGYKSATDPAFTSTEWWRHEGSGDGTILMENQYGLYEQMREMQVLHGSVGGHDEDMEL